MESLAIAGGAGSALATSIPEAKPADKTSVVLFRLAEKLKTTASHCMSHAISAREMDASYFFKHLPYLNEERDELIDAAANLAKRIDGYIAKHSPTEAPVLLERRDDLVREISYLCTVIDTNNGTALWTYQTGFILACPTLTKSSSPPAGRDPEANELPSIATDLRMVWGLPNGEKSSTVPDKLLPFCIHKSITELPESKKPLQLHRKYGTVKQYWNIYAPTFRDTLEKLLEDRATAHFSSKTGSDLSERETIVAKIAEYEKMYDLLNFYKDQILEITKEFLTFKLERSSRATPQEEDKEPESEETEKFSTYGEYNHLCSIYIRMKAHAATFKDRLDHLKTDLGLRLSEKK
jgi:hypothetical protein